MFNAQEALRQFPPEHMGAERQQARLLLSDSLFLGAAVSEAA